MTNDPSSHLKDEGVRPPKAHLAISFILTVNETICIVSCYLSNRNIALLLFSTLFPSPPTLLIDKEMKENKYTCSTYVLCPLCRPI